MQLEGIDNGTDVRAARRVFKNTVAQAVRFVATAASKFLIIVALARWRGVEQVGDFSFVMTFTITFAFLNNFGLILLLVREIARQRDRIHIYVGNALTISAALGVISVATMGGIAAWLGFSGQITTAIYLAALAMAIETLANVFNGAFGGYERMELTTLAIVIQETAFLIIGAVVFFLRLPFLWLFVIFILSRLAGLVSSASIYWRLWGRPRLRFDWPMIKMLSVKTLPFALNIALSPVFARVDVLLLSYLRGNVEVGYYVVASSLFYRFGALARSFNFALYPLIAREYAVRGRAVVDYIRRAVKFQAVVAMPITMLCWLLGGQIIGVIYGPDYQPAIIAFQIMATVTLLRLLGQTLGLTLAAIDLQMRRALATAALAAFNIAINMLVLPRFGFTGAAVTSVLTEVGYFVVLLAFVRSRLPNPVQLRSLIRPMLAALLMAVPLVLLHDKPLLLLLPLGLFSYALAAIALRVISPTEIEFLLRATRIEHLIPLGLRRLVGSTLE